MNIDYNVSLKGYNTFGIDEVAEQFVVLNAIQDLRPLGDFATERKVIGSGSNILCTQSIRLLLIANRIKGIEQVKEDEQHVWFEVASGELWHDFVEYVIDKGLSGVENLALIPGTVGAAPIQNIGAYGVEVKDVIESVTYWHWKDKVFKTLSNTDCQFGYRDSIFKRVLKDSVFISSVCFKLNKTPRLNTTYGAIEEELKRLNVQQPTPKDIARAVINIRRSKLPNPEEIGNAGSFFKNPTIPFSQLQQLQLSHPSMPFYKVDDDWMKVPAGWLIEQCGWKGYRKDDFGVHAKQALVLVNYGDASGDEILTLAQEIMASVQQSFGIALEPEVQIW